jgi:hypothetical protein
MTASKTLGECGYAPLRTGYVRRYVSLNPLLPPYLFRCCTSSGRFLLYPLHCLQSYLRPANFNSPTRTQSRFPDISNPPCTSPSAPTYSLRHASREAAVTLTTWSERLESLQRRRHSMLVRGNGPKLYGSSLVRRQTALPLMLMMSHFTPIRVIMVRRMDSLASGCKRSSRGMKNISRGAAGGFSLVIRRL